LARYIIRAIGAAGPLEFQERLTIEAALVKADELRSGRFSHITILNVLTGVEITDLEALLVSQEERCGDTNEKRLKKAVEQGRDSYVGLTG
jgi:hypothetical protein